MFISGMNPTAFDSHGWFQYDKTGKAECKKKIFVPETVCCIRGVVMQRETRRSVCQGHVRAQTVSFYSSQYSSSCSFSSHEGKRINTIFAGSSNTVRAQIQHCFQSYVQPRCKWIEVSLKDEEDEEDDGLWLNNVKWKYSEILPLKHLSYEKETQKELLLQKAIIFYGVSICQHYTSMNDVF